MAAVPLGPFVRFILFAATGVYQNWDTISGVFDRHVEAPTSPIFGYYVQNLFEMQDAASAFTTRERGMFGVHYINTTGGDLDTTWVTADYAAVESAVQTMWTANAARFSTQVRLVEHRWYAFGPGVNPPNPPIRVTTLGSPIVGTGTISAPHQTATTATFRTALRRHWGRIYLPTFTPSLGAGGQTTQAICDNIAISVATMIKTPNTSQGIVPVVYDRNRHAALGVTAVEVDSVPDIIRRRRPRNPAFKSVQVS